MHTGPWGIKVTLVEVKQVDLPDQMIRAIARQAEAERERRAKVIHAEGEYMAAEKLAMAAQVIQREPAALQLRYLQTLLEIGSEKNTTIVFPLPIDIIASLGRALGKMGSSGANRLTQGKESDLARTDEGEFELILGNRQLISVFLIVVILLGVFFSMGYIVGRNSAPLSPQCTARRQTDRSRAAVRAATQGQRRNRRPSSPPRKPHPRSPHRKPSVRRGKEGAREAGRRPPPAPRENRAPSPATSASVDAAPFRPLLAGGLHRPP